MGIRPGKGRSPPSRRDRRLSHVRAAVYRSRNVILSSEGDQNPLSTGQAHHPQPGNLDTMTSHEPELGPMTPPESGSAPPPTNWTPPSLSDSGQATYAGKAGAPIDTSRRTPSGSAIDAFSPPRTVWPILVVLVALIVGALVVYTGFQTAAGPTPTPSPSPSPHHTPNPSQKARKGTPFSSTTGSFTGIWRIVEYHWTLAGLQALIEVTVDEGLIRANYYAVSADGSDVAKVNTSLKKPALPVTTLRAGQTVRGWATFPLKERGTSMVFLTDISEPQVSGIEVTG